jgi:DNA-binding protein HU-beta
MNKSDLIAAVAEHATLSKADAGRAVDALTASITEALTTGDTVTLVGFGTFVVKDRPARTGRNPQTGLEMNLPASKSVGFKPGKGLKDSVNS